MDVKAISSNQATLQMNSQTSNIEQAKKINDENISNGIQNNLKQEIDSMQKQKVNKDELKKATETLQQKLSMLTQSQLKIETDEDTGIQVVKIIDQETKEVVRQLPPETVLKIAKYIDEITGLLYDKKA